MAGIRTSGVTIGVKAALVPPGRARGRGIKHRARLHAPRTTISWKYCVATIAYYSLNSSHSLIASQSKLGSSASLMPTAVGRYETGCRSGWSATSPTCRRAGPKAPLRAFPGLEPPSIRFGHNLPDSATFRAPNPPVVFEDKRLGVPRQGSGGHDRLPQHESQLAQTRAARGLRNSVRLHPLSYPITNALQYRIRDSKTALGIVIVTQHHQ